MEPSPVLAEALQGVLARAGPAHAARQHDDRPLIALQGAARGRGGRGGRAARRGAGAGAAGAVAAAVRAADRLEGLLPILFATASTQIASMRAGRATSLACAFDALLLVHVDDAPLTLTFVAEPSANVGLIWGVVPLVRAALEPVRATVVSHEAADEGSGF